MKENFIKLFLQVHLIELAHSYLSAIEERTIFALEKYHFDSDEKKHDFFNFFCNLAF